MPARLLLALLLALGAVMPAGAQRTPPNPLASIPTFDCTYTSFALGEWTDGTPAVEIRPQEFTFQIASIDPARGSARIVGNVGSAEATAVLTPIGLTLFERTPLGNFNITTIFVAGARGPSYLSVHSRHLGDPEEPPSVTQNYGSCVAPDR